MSQDPGSAASAEDSEHAETQRNRTEKSRMQEKMQEKMKEKMQEKTISENKKETMAAGLQDETREETRAKTTRIAGSVAVGQNRRMDETNLGGRVAGTDGGGGNSGGQQGGNDNVSSSSKCGSKDISSSKCNSKDVNEDISNDGTGAPKKAGQKKKGNRYAYDSSSGSDSSDAEGKGKKGGKKIAGRSSEGAEVNAVTKQHHDDKSNEAAEGGVRPTAISSKAAIKETDSERKGRAEDTQQKLAEGNHQNPAGDHLQPGGGQRNLEGHESQIWQVESRQQWKLDAFGLKACEGKSSALATIEGNNPKICHPEGRRDTFTLGGVKLYWLNRHHDRHNDRYHVNELDWGHVWVGDADPVLWLLSSASFPAKALNTFNETRQLFRRPDLEAQGTKITHTCLGGPDWSSFKGKKRIPAGMIWDEVTRDRLWLWDISGIGTRWAERQTETHPLMEDWDLGCKYLDFFDITDTPNSNTEESRAKSDGVKAVPENRHDDLFEQFAPKLMKAARGSSLSLLGDPEFVRMWKERPGWKKQAGHLIFNRDQQRPVRVSDRVHSRDSAANCRANNSAEKVEQNLKSVTSGPTASHSVSANLPKTTTRVDVGQNAPQNHQTRDGVGQNRNVLVLDGRRQWDLLRRCGPPGKDGPGGASLVEHVQRLELRVQAKQRSADSNDDSNRVRSHALISQKSADNLRKKRLLKHTLFSPTTSGLIPELCERVIDRGLKLDLIKQRILFKSQTQKIEAILR
jgi:hypothetical protein